MPKDQDELYGTLKSSSAAYCEIYIWPEVCHSKTTSSVARVTVLPKQIWPLLWGSMFQPKINVFVWTCCSNALALEERLALRNIKASSLYPYCGIASESVEHALSHCQMAKLSWFASCLSMHSTCRTLLKVNEWLLYWDKQSDLTLHERQERCTYLSFEDGTKEFEVPTLLSYLHRLRRTPPQRYCYYFVD
ncbi:hypothetical protein NE237_027498 [Protea cynaroides]|uniref:Reverse transcriptase zinc-binding domain-containing protein n=1 Tax=Protea cynaroides TaxID=273540 RepID=A0A9Q0GPG5_9MAGN|nr:hypothetical protein NE237_027498 [Protea cynaroides]